MAVFYWSIFRADLMTMLGAFLIGLFLDLLSGGPLGLNAATLLLIHELGVSQRRVFLGSSFLVNWTAFALVAGAEIGRASWRERVCQYVYISVVGVSLKKKTNIL